MSESIPVNSDKSLETAIELVKQSYDQFGYIELDIKVKGKKRSDPQRKALEVYCREMAQKLNDGGFDYQNWVEYAQSKGLEIPFSQELFKDIFREYAAALYPEIVGKNGKASTARLKRDMMTKAYDLVNLRMSTIFGVGMNWPSED